jgi:hypothetical protein
MTKLNDRIWEIVGTKVGYGIECDVVTDQLIDAVDEWLPTEHDTNSDGWNKCVRMLREKLR